ncbi:hypothetical protein Tco_1098901, partial [Tanacetum coccineum]
IDDLKHFTMTNENPSRVNLKQLCGRSVLTEPEIKDGGPLEANSLPWGRGKAVYISPLSLPRGRRDWIPLSLSMFCFDEFLLMYYTVMNFRFLALFISSRDRVRYASLLIMFCYLTVCGTFLIVSNGLALHDIALLLAIANGQSIAISNSDDTCAVCR